MKYVIALLALISVSAQAAHYGEAGCGLGTLIVGADGNQVLASTSNYTGLQVFAITSGTSNCTDDGHVRTSSRIPVYIEVNKLALAKEASRGQGEAITGLASLYGCSDTTFGAALKSNYKPVFEDTAMNPAGIQKNIDTMMSTNHAQVCGG